MNPGYRVKFKDNRYFDKNLKVTDVIPNCDCLFHDLTDKKAYELHVSTCTLRNDIFILNNGDCVKFNEIEKI